MKYLKLCFCLVLISLVSMQCTQTSKYTTQHIEVNAIVESSIHDLEASLKDKLDDKMFPSVKS